MGASGVGAGSFIPQKSPLYMNGNQYYYYWPVWCWIILICEKVVCDVILYLQIFHDGFYLPSSIYGGWLLEVQQNEKVETG
jgi:hypothetical protein